MAERTEAQKIYHRNHVRVHYLRGKAADQQCVKCDGPAEQWAQVHGESGEDPWADYVPLCRPCHAEYDYPERSAKIRAALTGKSPSAESREKMRAAKVGRKLTEEHKAKIAAAGTGKKHTPESLAKMSQVQRGKFVSEETRAKQRAAWVIRRERDKKSCEVEGCTGKYLAKGLCKKHYHEKRRKEKDNGVS